MEPDLKKRGRICGATKYYIGALKYQIMILCILCVFIACIINSSIFQNILNQNNIDLICNVIYSIIAAQIFYIFTISIPALHHRRKHARLILYALSKIQTIIDTYHRYSAEQYHKKFNNDKYYKNYSDLCKHISKILSKIAVTCSFVEEFNTECELTEITGFIDRIKSSFMHHFNEILNISELIDKKVLFCLYEVRLEIDSLNSIKKEKGNLPEAISSLCKKFESIHKKLLTLQLTIDERYCKVIPQ